jgi:hypothetical protein
MAALGYRRCVREWIALVLVAACGRIGFDPGGDDRPPVITPASRLDLLVGRHDPAGYTDGTGLAARFSHPYAIVAVDTQLYVADSDNGTIRRVDMTTGAVSTIAGQPWGYGDANGIGAAAQFEWITGITFLNGILYVSDFNANVIRSVDTATGEVKLFAGKLDRRGGVDGPALGMATFYQPVGITTDSVDLYVVESEGQRVRRITMATGQVTLLAGGVDGAMDGTGAAAQFHYPSAISYAAGLLYVSDQYNRSVRAIDPATAVVTTVATSEDGGVQSAAVAGSDVYFASASGLFDYNTSASSTKALAGERWSYGAMDGDAMTARFHTPRGLTIAGTKLYLADTENSSIRIVDVTTKLTTTLAGNVEPTAGPVDGVGPTARFDQLNGIASDGKRVWVTDENNCTIHEIDPATGSSKLIAGTGRTFGTDDGIGEDARFHRPAGIATRTGCAGSIR